MFNKAQNPLSDAIPPTPTLLSGPQFPHLAINKDIGGDVSMHHFAITLLS